MPSSCYVRYSKMNNFKRFSNFNVTNILYSSFEKKHLLFGNYTKYNTWTRYVMMYFRF